MRRRLFNALTLLSLLLCAAACFLWANSYWYRDVVMYAPGAGASGYGVVSSRGTVYFAGVTEYGPYGRRWLIGRQPARPLFEDAPGLLGFVFLSGPQVSGVGVPHWFVGLLAASAPLVWLGRRRRALRRPGDGVCRRCGYDLRATTDRCPECGTAVAKPAAGGS